MVQAKHGHKVVIAMGDGATDLEARQAGGADIFIGCAPVLKPSLGIAKRCHNHVQISRPSVHGICKEKSLLPGLPGAGLSGLLLIPAVIETRWHVA